MSSRRGARPGIRARVQAVERAGRRAPSMCAHFEVSCIDCECRVHTRRESPRGRTAPSPVTRAREDLRGEIRDARLHVARRPSTPRAWIVERDARRVQTRWARGASPPRDCTRHASRDFHPPRRVRQPWRCAVAARACGAVACGSRRCHNAIVPALPRIGWSRLATGVVRWAARQTTRASIRCLRARAAAVSLICMIRADAVAGRRTGAGPSARAQARPPAPARRRAPRARDFLEH